MSQTAIVEKEALEESLKIATEAISNIRTIASLSKFYPLVAKGNVDH